jgi:hypothetical protein
VWDTAGDVWTDLSVDSVVGNRSFLSAPRAHLQLAAANTLPAGQNLISTSLWGADAASIPANIYTAINAALTAAFTDIRPEDALFAENRTNSTTVPGALGYTTADKNVGAEIKSTYTTAQAQPVQFALSGQKDPITSTVVPASTTIPIGATPIIFFANRTTAKVNLGTSLSTTQADDAFSACGVVNGKNVTTVVREPISGTMNTTEFTTFLNTSGPELSQENGVPHTDNPLNISCPSSTHRTRAIGTGDLVSAVQGTTVPSIGYAFFGYGNFSKIAANPQYTYFELNSIDPIQKTYTTGELPTCTAPCPITPGSSFPNLRNGTYTAWSVLRAVTDASGVNDTNTKNLVVAIQDNVNSSVPDFVPYNKVTTSKGTDPGLLYYRSHYTQSGVSPNNGFITGQAEAGGDMGGCIELKPIGSSAGVLNCKDFLYPPK